MPLQGSLQGLTLKAKEGTRTLDLRITNATRYQLRHFGMDYESILVYYTCSFVILQSLFLCFFIFVKLIAFLYNLQNFRCAPQDASSSLSGRLLSVLSSPPAVFQLFFNLLWYNAIIAVERP